MLQYGKDFMAQLAPVCTAPETKNGGMITSCICHGCPWPELVLNNKSSCEHCAAWFAGSTTGAASIHIDTRLPNGDGTLAGGAARAAPRRSNDGRAAPQDNRTDARTPWPAAVAANTPVPAGAIHRTTWRCCWLCAGSLQTCRKTPCGGSWAPPPSSPPAGLARCPELTHAEFNFTLGARRRHHPPRRVHRAGGVQLHGLRRPARRLSRPRPLHPAGKFRGQLSATRRPRPSRTSATVPPSTTSTPPTARAPKASACPPTAYRLAGGSGAAAARRSGSSNLGYNGLTGPFPDLAACPRLEELDLQEKALALPLPDCKASTALVQVQVQANRLTGTIPNLAGRTC